MDLNRFFHRQVAPALILILGAGMISHTGRADLIYFQKGGNVQVPATTEGNRVILAMPDGNVALPRELIRKRVPGFWPETEWNARRQKALAEGFAARYAAVWWAIENGLTTEVTDELRKLHALDPSHAPTMRMVAALDRLDQPCTDPNSAGFCKALAIGTQLARGPHVILLHQHSETEAEERIALLERVIRGYYLLFAAQGLELSLPRHRLMSAWFADENDYRAFLHSENADVFATTRGYYHATWNAVVAYDARSTELQRTTREKLGVKRDELRRYGEMVDQAPARTRVRIKVGEEPLRTVGRQEAKTLIERLDGEVNCENLLLELDRRSIDLGTAAHEMIHQLANNSGLLPRHDTFPHWLHEGFAAQFEVIRGGRWAGISRAHDLRLPDWRKLPSPPRLERLVRDAGFGRGYQRDLYAQAWALVYYLRTQHPQQFLTFLDLLRGPNADGPSPTKPAADRVFNAFQRAFGSDLDGLESDWHQFMKNVQTPLEQNAPTADATPKPKPPAARGKT
jgi:Protein of unknown function (DUF1570)